MMGMKKGPAPEGGRGTKLLVRAIFLVALAAAGLFASTALSSSTTESQAVRGKAIAGKPARVIEKSDVSTLPKMKRYLRSIGVNPRSVVIQRGRKNYAGPRCPGKAWTCTKARRVMQVGTLNTFECSPTPIPAPTNAPGFQECVIVQGPAAKNVAKCIEKSKHVPFVRQRCSITQSGTYNEAIIVQVADQTSGPPALAMQQVGALQEVGISQTATATVNRLQIDQEIKQLSETSASGVTQDQDAYQVVGFPFAATATGGTPAPPTGSATQFALVVADNASQIVQKQIQRAKGGLVQKQNDGAYTPPAPFGGPPSDCHPVPVISPAAPNACVNLDQTAADGTNHQGQLSQLIDQEATTTAAAVPPVIPPAVPAVVDQQQGPRLSTGLPAPFTGGADARVHQAITGDSGSSQNQAHQSETLKLFGPPGSNQTQSGGAGCCGFGSQAGGENNQERITQDKLLEAKGGTEQVATLVGTSSSPDGNCAINHNVQTNSDQETESASAEPCFGLAVFTTCANASTNGEEDEVVGQCENASVTACPPGTTPVVEEGNGFDVECVEPNGNGTTTTFTGPS
jgi:hypothetical protein